MIFDTTEKDSVKVVLEIKPKNKWKFLKHIYFYNSILYTTDLNKDQAKAMVKILNEWIDEDVSEKSDKIPNKNVYQVR